MHRTLQSHRSLRLLATFISTSSGLEASRREDEKTLLTSLKPVALHTRPVHESSELLELCGTASKALHASAAPPEVAAEASLSCWEDGWEDKSVSCEHPPDAATQLSLHLVIIDAWLYPNLAAEMHREALPCLMVARTPEHLISNIVVNMAKSKKQALRNDP
ncbi:hypothetical protein PMIN01_07037 [Paraphaeosphaeria minitans]|uniref:Uncharacterized protein n=1 Tax=Paraphaeosphaeria minitans TaxID=565426 RepID=A0A9P6GH57_9PLEO|nr:hypothetical protein PMIN01_07037 [Paraphaeosphaeria minitans]